MKVIHTIAFTLIIIGALNWGLVGVADFNLVAKIFGMGALTKVIYILVGLSAISEVVMHPKNCRQCKPDGTMAAAKPMM